MPIRIYLAGPEVFLAEAREIGARKRAICARHGLVGVFRRTKKILAIRPCHYPSRALPSAERWNPEHLCARLWITHLRDQRADLGCWPVRVMAMWTYR